MRAEAVALGVLVLAPLALAQEAPLFAPWTQQGGDMERSGVAALGGVTLDVLLRGQLAEGPLQIAGVGPAGVIETPHGLVTATFAFDDPDTPLVDEGAPCTMRWHDPATLAATREADVPCTARAAVLAYEPALDLLLGCVHGERPLRAWEGASGELRWDADPEHAGATSPSLGCATIGLDPAGDEIVVGFEDPDTSVGTVSAFTLSTGEHLWSRGIPADVVAPPPPAPLPEASVPALLIPEFVTLTPEAILVRGLPMTTVSTAVTGRAASAAVAWIDREGNLVGRLHPPAGAPTDASQWAVASGSQGTLLFSGALWMLNLQNENAAPAPLPPGLTADLEAAPPSWTPPTLLVPTHGALTRFDSTTLLPTWTWRAPEGAFVYHVLLAPPGDVYVLQAVVANERTTTILHRLEASSGRELQRLDLGDVADGIRPSQFELQLLPIASTRRLLVYSDFGPAVLLGPSPDETKPRITLSTAYPGVEEPFRLTPLAAAGASLTVAWGDGAVEPAISGADLAHQYAEARPFVVRVTATHADGTTATGEAIVRVGEDDPGRLTAIQRAFSRDRQESTFFLLGLALTGGGALFAAFLRRRRQSNLAQETRRLHELQDLAGRDPGAGLAALEAHRTHLEDAYARRRLDDAHFALLDQRTVRAMRATRLALIGPVLNALTPHFRDLLTTALDDGRISPGELATLRRALASERIEETERSRVDELLAGWSR